MILDIEMLRSFYASYSESVAQAKATVKRPLCTSFRPNTVATI